MPPSGSLRKRCLRLSALVTLFFFASTSVSWGQPVTAGIPQDLSVLKTVIPVDLQIPSELGQVESHYRGAMNRPYVIYVQDAHSIIDAQNHIQEIIRFFQEKYGVKTVAVEGGSGEMDPTLLRSFPDVFLKEKVMKEYLTRGEMTGASLAAVLNSGRGRYHGLENWNLYEQNYLAYLQAQQVREDLLGALEKALEQLNQDSARVFSSELKQFQQARADFYDEKIDLVSFLKKVHPGDAAGLKKDYPEIALLLETIQKDGQQKEEDLEASIHQIGLQFKKRYQAKLNKQAALRFAEHLQLFETGQMDKGEFLKELTDMGNAAGVKLRMTPAMKELLGYSEKLTAIKGTRLFEQLEAWLAKTEKELTRNPEQKNLLEKYRKARILKSLITLELSREDWDLYQSDFAAYSDFIGKESGKLEPARRFYEFALRRDNIFHENLEKIIRKEKTDRVVVLTGGFHASGFKKALEEAQYSYAVITPKIQSLAGQESYKEVMQGQVSYKQYLTDNFYEAFMKASTLKLAAGMDEREFKKNLKLWRDDVIRNLSAEGRVAEAGKYTRYIDLLFKIYQDKFGDFSKSDVSRDEIVKALERELIHYKENTMNGMWRKFESQFGIFSAGFQDLISKKQVNAENVSALLDRVKTAQPSALGTAITTFPENHAASWMIDSRDVPAFIPPSEVSAVTMEQSIKALIRAAGNAQPNAVPSAAAKRLAQQVRNENENAVALKARLGADFKEIPQKSIDDLVKARLAEQAKNPDVAAQIAADALNLILRDNPSFPLDESQLEFARSETRRINEDPLDRLRREIRQEPDENDETEWFTRQAQIPIQISNLPEEAIVERPTPASLIIAPSKIQDSGLKRHLAAQWAKVQDETFAEGKGALDFDKALYLMNRPEEEGLQLAFIDENGMMIGIMEVSLYSDSAHIEVIGSSVPGRNIGTSLMKAAFNYFLNAGIPEVSWNVQAGVRAGEVSEEDAKKNKRLAGFYRNFLDNLKASGVDLTYTERETMSGQFSFQAALPKNFAASAAVPFAARAEINQKSRSEVRNAPSELKQIQFKMAEQYNLTMGRLRDLLNFTAALNEITPSEEELARAYARMDPEKSQKIQAGFRDMAIRYARVNEQFELLDKKMEQVLIQAQEIVLVLKASQTPQEALGKLKQTKLDFDKTIESYERLIQEFETAKEADSELLDELFDALRRRSEMRGNQNLDRRAFLRYTGAAIVSAAVLSDSLMSRGQAQEPVRQTTAPDNDVLSLAKKLLNKSQMNPQIYETVRQETGINSKIPFAQFQKEIIPAALINLVARALTRIKQDAPGIYQLFESEITGILLVDDKFPARANRSTKTVIIGKKHLAEMGKALGFESMVVTLAHEGAHLGKEAVEDPSEEELRVRVLLQPLFEKIFGINHAASENNRFEIDQFRAAKELLKEEVAQSFVAGFIVGNITPNLPEKMTFGAAYDLMRRAVQAVRGKAGEYPVILSLNRGGNQGKDLSIQWKSHSFTGNIILNDNGISYSSIKDADDKAIYFEQNGKIEIDRKSRSEVRHPSASVPFEWYEPGSESVVLSNDERTVLDDRLKIIRVADIYFRITRAGNKWSAEFWNPEADVWENVPGIGFEKGQSGKVFFGRLGFTSGFSEPVLPKNLNRLIYPDPENPENSPISRAHFAITAVPSGEKMIFMFKDSSRNGTVLKINEDGGVNSAPAAAPMETRYEKFAAPLHSMAHRVDAAVLNQVAAKINTRVPPFLIDEAALKVNVNPAYFNPLYQGWEKHADPVQEIARKMEIALTELAEAGVLTPRVRKMLQKMFTQDALAYFIFKMQHVLYETNDVRLGDEIIHYLRDYLKLNIPQTSSAERQEIVGRYAHLARLARPYSRAALLNGKMPKAVILEGEAGQDDPDVMVIERTGYSTGRGRRVPAGLLSESEEITDAEGRVQEVGVVRYPPEKVIFARWKGRRFMLYISRSHTLGSAQVHTWRQAEGFININGGWISKSNPENMDDLPAEFALAIDKINPRIESSNDEDDFRERLQELGFFNFFYSSEIEKIYAASSPRELAGIRSEFNKTIQSKQFWANPQIQAAFKQKEAEFKNPQPVQPRAASADDSVVLVSLDTTRRVLEEGESILFDARFPVSGALGSNSFSIGKDGRDWKIKIGNKTAVLRDKEPYFIRNAAGQERVFVYLNKEKYTITIQRLAQTERDVVVEGTLRSEVRNSKNVPAAAGSSPAALAAQQREAEEAQPRGLIARAKRGLSQFFTNYKIEKFKKGLRDPKNIVHFWFLNVIEAGPEVYIAVMEEALNPENTDIPPQMRHKAVAYLLSRRWAPKGSEFYARSKIPALKVEDLEGAIRESTNGLDDTFIETLLALHTPEARNLILQAGKGSYEQARYVIFRTLLDATLHPTDETYAQNAVNLLREIMYLGNLNSYDDVMKGFKDSPLEGSYADTIPPGLAGLRRQGDLPFEVNLLPTGSGRMTAIKGNAVSVSALLPNVNIKGSGIHNHPNNDVFPSGYPPRGYYGYEDYTGDLILVHAGNNYFIITSRGVTKYSRDMNPSQPPQPFKMNLYFEDSAPQVLNAEGETETHRVFNSNNPILFDAQGQPRNFVAKDLMGPNNQSFTLTFVNWPTLIQTLADGRFDALADFLPPAILNPKNMKKGDADYLMGLLENVPGLNLEMIRAKLLELENAVPAEAGPAKAQDAPAAAAPLPPSAVSLSTDLTAVTQNVSSDYRELIQTAGALFGNTGKVELALMVALESDHQAGIQMAREHLGPGQSPQMKRAVIRGLAEGADFLSAEEAKEFLETSFADPDARIQSEAINLLAEVKLDDKTASRFLDEALKDQGDAAEAVGITGRMKMSAEKKKEYFLKYVSSLQAYHDYLASLFNRNLFGYAPGVFFHSLADAKLSSADNFEILSQAFRSLNSFELTALVYGGKDSVLNDLELSDDDLLALASEVQTLGHLNPNDGERRPMNANAYAAAIRRRVSSRTVILEEAGTEEKPGLAGVYESKAAEPFDEMPAAERARALEAWASAWVRKFNKIKDTNYNTDMAARNNALTDFSEIVKGLSRWNLGEEFNFSFIFKVLKGMKPGFNSRNYFNLSSSFEQTPLRPQDAARIYQFLFEGGLPLFTREGRSLIYSIMKSESLKANPEWMLPFIERESKELYPGDTDRFRSFLNILLDANLPVREDLRLILGSGAFSHEGDARFFKAMADRGMSFPDDFTMLDALQTHYPEHIDMLKDFIVIKKRQIKAGRIPANMAPLEKPFQLRSEMRQEGKRDLSNPLGVNIKGPGLISQQPAEQAKGPDIIIPAGMNMSVDDGGKINPEQKLAGMILAFANGVDEIERIKNPAKRLSALGFLGLGLIFIAPQLKGRKVEMLDLAKEKFEKLKADAKEELKSRSEMRMNPFRAIKNYFTDRKEFQQFKAEVEAWDKPYFLMDSENVRAAKDQLIKLWPKTNRNLREILNNPQLIENLILAHESRVGSEAGPNLQIYIETVLKSNITPADAEYLLRHEVLKVIIADSRATSLPYDAKDWNGKSRKKGLEEFLSVLEKFPGAYVKYRLLTSREVSEELFPENIGKPPEVVEGLSESPSSRFDGMMLSNIRRDPALTPELKSFVISSHLLTLAYSHRNDPAKAAEMVKRLYQNPALRALVQQPAYAAPFTNVDHQAISMTYLLSGISAEPQRFLSSAESLEAFGKLENKDRFLMKFLSLEAEEQKWFVKTASLLPAAARAEYFEALVEADNADVLASKMFYEVTSLLGEKNLITLFIDPSWKKFLFSEFSMFDFWTRMMPGKRGAAADAFIDSLRKANNRPVALNAMKVWSTMHEAAKGSWQAAYDQEPFLKTFAFLIEKNVSDEFFEEYFTLLLGRGAYDSEQIYESLKGIWFDTGFLEKVLRMDPRIQPVFLKILKGNTGYRSRTGSPHKNLEAELDRFLPFYNILPPGGVNFLTRGLMGEFSAEQKDALLEKFDRFNKLMQFYWNHNVLDEKVRIDPIFFSRVALMDMDEVEKLISKRETLENIAALTSDKDPFRSLADWKRLGGIHDFAMPFQEAAKRLTRLSYSPSSDNKFDVFSTALNLSSLGVKDPVAFIEAQKDNLKEMDPQRYFMTLRSLIPGIGPTAPASYFADYVREIGMHQTPALIQMYAAIKKGEFDNELLVKAGITAKGKDQKEKIKNAIEQLHKVIRDFYVELLQKDKLPEDILTNKLKLDLLRVVTNFDGSRWARNIDFEELVKNFIEDQKLADSNDPASSKIVPLAPEFTIQNPDGTFSPRTFKIRARKNKLPAKKEEGAKKSAADFAYEKISEELRAAVEVVNTPEPESVKAFQAEISELIQLEAQSLQAFKDGPKGSAQEKAEAAKKLEKTGPLQAEVAGAVVYRDLIAALGKYKPAKSSELAARLKTLLFIAGLQANLSYAEGYKERFHDLGEMSSSNLSAVLEFMRTLVKEHVVGENEQHDEGPLKGDPRFDSGMRKTLRGYLNVNVLEEELKVLKSSTSSEWSEYTVLPTRGILGELSGYFFDACWTSQINIMRENPHMTAFVFIENADDLEKIQIVGGTLLLNHTIAKKPAWVMRGFNPQDRVAEKHSMADLLDSFHDELKKLPTGNERKIVIPGSGSGASSNRPDVNAELGTRQTPAQALKLDREEKFNGYHIENAVYELIPQTAAKRSEVRFEVASVDEASLEDVKTALLKILEQGQKFPGANASELYGIYKAQFHGKSFVTKSGLRVILEARDFSMTGIEFNLKNEKGDSLGLGSLTFSERKGNPAIEFGLKIYENSRQNGISTAFIQLFSETIPAGMVRIQTIRNKETLEELTKQLPRNLRDEIYKKRDQGMANKLGIGIFGGDVMMGRWAAALAAVLRNGELSKISIADTVSGKLAALFGDDSRLEVENDLEIITTKRSEARTAAAQALIRGAAGQPKYGHLTTLENAQSILRYGFYQAVGLRTFVPYGESYENYRNKTKIEIVFNDAPGLVAAETGFRASGFLHLTEKSRLSETELAGLKEKIGEASFRKISIDTKRNGIGHLPLEYINLDATQKRNFQRVRAHELDPAAYEEFLRFAAAYLDEVKAPAYLIRRSEVRNTEESAPKDALYERVNDLVMPALNKILENGEFLKKLNERRQRFAETKGIKADTLTPEGFRSVLENQIMGLPEKYSVPVGALPAHIHPDKQDMIFFLRDFAEALTDEEFLLVYGHELGHILLRSGTELSGIEKAVNQKILEADQNGIAMKLSAEEIEMLSRFSQFEERECDDLATDFYRIAADSEKPTASFAGVFAKQDQIFANSPNYIKEEGNPALAALDGIVTHPDSMFRGIRQSAEAFLKYAKKLGTGGENLFHPISPKEFNLGFAVSKFEIPDWSKLDPASIFRNPSSEKDNKRSEMRTMNEDEQQAFASVLEMAKKSESLDEMIRVRNRLRGARMSYQRQINDLTATGKRTDQGRATGIPDPGMRLDWLNTRLETVKKAYAELQTRIEAKQNRSEMRTIEAEIENAALYPSDLIRSADLFKTLKQRVPAENYQKLYAYDEAHFEFKDGYWTSKDFENLVLGTWQDVNLQPLSGLQKMQRHVVSRYLTADGQVRNVYSFDNHVFSTLYLSETILRGDIPDRGLTQIFVDEHNDALPLGEKFAVPAVGDLSGLKAGMESGNLNMGTFNTLLAKQGLLEKHFWIVAKGNQYERWREAGLEQNKPSLAGVVTAAATLSQYSSIENRPRNQTQNVILNIDTDTTLKSDDISSDALTPEQTFAFYKKHLLDLIYSDGVIPSVMHATTTVSSEAEYGDVRIAQFLHRAAPLVFLSNVLDRAEVEAEISRLADEYAAMLSRSEMRDESSFLLGNEMEKALEASKNMGQPFKILNLTSGAKGAELLAFMQAHPETKMDVYGISPDAETETPYANGHLIKGNGGDLPQIENAGLTANSFDVITENGIFKDLGGPKSEALFIKIMDLLKIGGKLIIYGGFHHLNHKEYYQILREINVHGTLSVEMVEGQPVSVITKQSAQQASNAFLDLRNSVFTDNEGLSYKLGVAVTPQKLNESVHVRMTPIAGGKIYDWDFAVNPEKIIDFKSDAHLSQHVDKGLLAQLLSAIANSQVITQEYKFIAELNDPAMLLEVMETLVKNYGALPDHNPVKLQFWQMTLEEERRSTRPEQTVNDLKKYIDMLFKSIREISPDESSFDIQTTAIVRLLHYFGSDAVLDSFGEQKETKITIETTQLHTKRFYHDLRNAIGTMQSIFEALEMFVSPDALGFTGNPAGLQQLFAEKLAPLYTVVPALIAEMDLKSQKPYIASETAEFARRAYEALSVANIERTFRNLEQILQMGGMPDGELVRTMKLGANLARVMLGEVAGVESADFEERPINPLLRAAIANFGNKQELQLRIAVNPSIKEITAEKFESYFQGHPMSMEDEDIVIGKIQEARLARVITNLVKNAAEASAVNAVGKVLVGMYEEAGKIVIKVIDNGGGLSENLIALINSPEPITDAHISTKGSKGTGVGLSTSKAFIQSWGGSLKAEVKNGLTEFTVILPTNMERSEVRNAEENILAELRTAGLTDADIVRNANGRALISLKNIDPAKMPYAMTEITDEAMPDGTNKIFTAIDDLKAGAKVNPLEPLSEMPLLAGADLNRKGIYLGHINTLENLAAIKIFNPRFGKFGNYELNEIIYAQIWDRLGIGPQFYGILTNDTGEIIGYAMQPVLMVSAAVAEGSVEISKRLAGVGFDEGHAGALFIKTVANKSVLLDPGNLKVADGVKHQAYLARFRSEVRAAYLFQRAFAGNAARILNKLAPGSSSAQIEKYWSDTSRRSRRIEDGRGWRVSIIHHLVLEGKPYKFFTTHYEETDPAVAEKALGEERAATNQAYQNQVGPETELIEFEGKKAQLAYEIGGMSLGAEGAPAAISFSNKSDRLKFVAALAFALGKLHRAGIQHHDLVNSIARAGYALRGNNIFIQDWETEQPSVRFIDFEFASENASEDMLTGEANAVKSAAIKRLNLGADNSSEYEELFAQKYQEGLGQKRSEVRTANASFQFKEAFGEEQAKTILTDIAKTNNLDAIETYAVTPMANSANSTPHHLRIENNGKLTVTRATLKHTVAVQGKTYSFYTTAQTSIAVPPPFPGGPPGVSANQSLSDSELKRESDLTLEASKQKLGPEARIGTYEGRLVMVTPEIQGRNLASYSVLGSDEKVEKFVGNFAYALGKLHGLGIEHGDLMIQPRSGDFILRPENIFILDGPEESIAFIDYEYARRLKPNEIPNEVWFASDSSAPLTGRPELDGVINWLGQQGLTLPTRNMKNEAVRKLKEIFDKNYEAGKEAVRSEVRETALSEVKVPAFEQDAFTILLSDYTAEQIVKQYLANNQSFEALRNSLMKDAENKRNEIDQQFELALTDLILKQLPSDPEAIWDWVNGRDLDQLLSDFAADLNTLRLPADFISRQKANLKDLIQGALAVAVVAQDQLVSAAVLQAAVNSAQLTPEGARMLRWASDNPAAFHSLLRQLEGDQDFQIQYNASNLKAFGAFTASANPQPTALGSLPLVIDASLLNENAEFLRQVLNRNPAVIFERGMNLKSLFRIMGVRFFGGTQRERVTDVKLGAQYAEAFYIVSPSTPLKLVKERFAGRGVQTSEGAVIMSKLDIQNFVRMTETVVQADHLRKYLEPSTNPFIPLPVMSEKSVSAIMEFFNILAKIPAADRAVASAA